LENSISCGKSYKVFNLKNIRIRYLRHGITKTGGARHEEILLHSIQDELQNLGFEFKADTLIAGSIFKGLANLKLIAWGLRKSSADINIVVGRLALSSLIRNLFSNRKTLIVLHNFDKKDGKGFLLKKYYALLFAVLKKASKSKVAIITVSPFFQNYFSQKFPNLNVFHFPNLFEAHKYKIQTSRRNNRKILLGQYSSKMDNSVYRLAHQLKKQGYNNFFCTLRPEEAAEFENYSVKSLTYDEYLFEMATAYCSLSLSRVLEGWPRMVHESILVGTPVIGYDKGGLGDLLRESNSYIVKNHNEALNLLITGSIEYKTSIHFINKYDISTTAQWLLPIINYILNK
jgi:hypothetical protein